ncbi:MAG: hypothetical protein A3J09_00770 [Candidatus Zambryskibacteria bacterium RIFCSPLOWO2_02_FULL_51_21]|uniref:Uncharacterized protein n=1 Tax=Candidatus Zambryskibacteria bacterium RIFCSPHIGHO2_02_FULL_43_37 TaxID=1802749 RepID=A0A1G2THQ7_9BACT|nr:MAG: hypothetical protein A2723_00765 [Candidatus Zambryskibacteria bacterium RIFCSPHIGHO2_01_FULL_52_18]OHA96733.1 MAG: hypothetical protein A3D49_02730 [Candidatus Zambryskibacteria bacterium RIFCSPHIGHO2_02_FULL_43_37]OHB07427.1 MAG: hypothetical protein A2944_01805 [Candidatus Zambryskibacteria bacterium RIFCSPLOWO2_01_FULL_52_12]OHB11089.1 MAG: hypothetical protein A3J09_00770 [Candidatus Zambryskibacteria bacterium RIFCSPLOWO2_02_FULL_51_21]
MQKYFAIAAALATVGIFFYGNKLNLPLIDNLNLELNTAPIDPAGVAAWNTFEQYRTYATENNLEGVKSISHQVSETCKNPATLAECENLMQSVAAFTKDLRGSDFKTVYYDDRQIVLVSDPVETAEGNALVQILLFFTRTSSGEPRVLGMRFCFKNKGEENKSCFNADPAIRDQNQNGWWDAVESLFYK